LKTSTPKPRQRLAEIDAELRPLVMTPPPTTPLVAKRRMVARRCRPALLERARRFGASGTRDRRIGSSDQGAPG
jgi:hypothetical protein